MITKMKFTLLPLLASLLAFASGCALFAFGAAGYTYAKGELKSTEPAPLDRTWDATVAAVKELQFPIVEQSKDALEARLVEKMRRTRTSESSSRRLPIIAPNFMFGSAHSATKPSLTRFWTESANASSHVSLSIVRQKASALLYW